MSGENVYTSAALLASYHAAMRIADREGVFHANRASMAGFLLAEYGTVRAAIAHCAGTTGFWGSVRDLLERVGQSEIQAAATELRAIKGGR